MISARRRDRPHPARQQQRLLPGLRAVVDGLVAVRDERRPARRSPASVTALRRDHPVFRRRRFFEGKPIRTGDQVRDIAWLTPAGTEMTPEDWDSGLASASRCSSTARRSRRPTRAANGSSTTRSCCASTPTSKPRGLRHPGRVTTPRSGPPRSTPADATGATDVVVKAGEKVSLQARSVLVLRKTA